jgi:hypothetical protein
MLYALCFMLLALSFSLTGNFGCKNRKTTRFWEVKLLGVVHKKTASKIPETVL